MKDDSTKTVTIKDINKKIWRQSKAAAALNGQNISNFVNKALQVAINKNK